MIKTRKIATVILVLLSLALMVVLGCQKQKGNSINIGAILPLTGAAAHLALRHRDRTPHPSAAFAAHRR